MTLIQIERTPGTIVTVNVVEGYPLAMREWAIVTGHLLDDATGLTILSGITIVLDALDASVAALRIKLGADGWFALTGRPLRLFPGLATQLYPILFTVYATGYQPLVVAESLPAQAGFPDAFTPRALGDIRLLPA